LVCDTLENSDHKCRIKAMAEIASEESVVLAKHF
jgi:hypothetical protein